MPSRVYRSDFFLEGAPFWTFPFGASLLIDPTGRSGWFLDGPWDDWAYLFYQDASRHSALMWKVWLGRKMPAVPRTRAVHVEVTRVSDGVLLCRSNPPLERVRQPWWQRFEFPLDWPPDSLHPGLGMDAQTLLAHDAAYTATLKIEGQVYGQWKFAVVDGQLSRDRRTDPETADPLSFIQRGVDAWWYERERASGLTVPTVGVGGQEQGSGPEPPAGGVTSSGVQQAGPAGGGAAAGTRPAQVIPGSTPITVNGHTLVPLRAIFEWLGAQVNYLPQALTVVATRGDTTILMRMDENEATVNARRVPMAQPPLLRDGRTYVPLRLVAEAFGCTLSLTGGVITIADDNRLGIVR